MPKVLSALACNLDSNILQAAVPLLQHEKVEAIEWSFDTLFSCEKIPGWFTDLIKTYSDENRLIGHGVFFSLFSGKWLPEQENWLHHLRLICSQFRFDHITEHFGFLTGKDFHSGAPLNIPYSSAALRIGRDRLKRIYDACLCPVGLENLAFSYSLEEVKRHGEFLEKLIDPVNGFIILDLHNLYCQIHNFSIGYEEIIELYPLDRVRELHISGGSWQPIQADSAKIIRRDTHDEAVPTQVFDILKKTIHKCPNLKYVVLEQLGTGLETKESRQLFCDDYIAMQQVVHNKNSSATTTCMNNQFLPNSLLTNNEIPEDLQLYNQQMELSCILENSASWQDAIHSLSSSSLAHSEWNVEQWEPGMIETAWQIAQKWK